MNCNHLEDMATIINFLPREVQGAFFFKVLEHLYVQNDHNFSYLLAKIMMLLQEDTRLYLLENCSQQIFSKISFAPQRGSFNETYLFILQNINLENISINSPYNALMVITRALPEELRAAFVCKHIKIIFERKDLDLIRNSAEIASLLPEKDHSNFYSQILASKYLRNHKATFCKTLSSLPTLDNVDLPLDRFYQGAHLSVFLLTIMPNRLKKLRVELNCPEFTLPSFEQLTEFFYAIACHFQHTEIAYSFPPNQLEAIKRKIQEANENEDSSSTPSTALSTMRSMGECFSFTNTSIVMPHNFFVTMLITMLNQALCSNPVDADLVNGLFERINADSILDPEMAETILIGLVANKFYAIFFSLLKKLPLEDESIRFMISRFLWDELDPSNEQFFTERQLKILIERLSQRNTDFSPVTMKSILESEAESDDFKAADLARYCNLFSNRMVQCTVVGREEIAHPLYASINPSNSPRDDVSAASQQLAALQNRTETHFQEHTPPSTVTDMTNMTNTPAATAEGMTPYSPENAAPRSARVASSLYAGTPSLEPPSPVGVSRFLPVETPELAPQSPAEENPSPPTAPPLVLTDEDLPPKKSCLQKCVVL